MNEEEFLSQCKKSPLFKNISITKKTLKEYNFKKKGYEVQDLVVLSKLLRDFCIVPEEPKDLKKIPSEYLLNRELLKRADRKQDVARARKQLGIPVIKAFRLNKKLGGKLSLAPSRLAGRGSSQFQKWLINFEGGPSLAKEKIKEKVLYLLNRWELPENYHYAIEELLLFNRIIPAFKARYHLKEHPFFKDKEELWMRIEKIPSPGKRLISDKKILKFYTKNLLGKIRRGKRSKYRKDILYLYEKFKKEGIKDKNIPPRIKKELWNLEVSVDGIRKIIKRS